VIQDERLDFLIRKNRGKSKLDEYKQLCKNFNLKSLEFIELEESDQVRKKIRSAFPSVEHESEMINNDLSRSSNLLNEVLSLTKDDDQCYIFTDDVYTCGMFKTYTKSALNICFGVAFLAYENTCFIVDRQFNFSFTVNYYGEDHMDFKDKFEVQGKIIRFK